MYLEILKIRFRVVLWYILVSKIPQFLVKSYWWRAHHTFLGSRHPEVAKICFMFCLSTRAKYSVFKASSSSWTINLYNNWIKWLPLKAFIVTNKRSKQHYKNSNCFCFSLWNLFFPAHFNFKCNLKNPEWYWVNQKQAKDFH